MNPARKWMAQVSAKLQLPGNIMAGIPRIEVIGIGEFAIETHRGLVHYSDERITVSSTLGDISVIGTGLRIRIMNRERIVVIGTITNIEFPG